MKTSCRRLPLGLERCGAGPGGQVWRRPAMAPHWSSAGSSTELPLTVSYDKISLGRLRFLDPRLRTPSCTLQQFGEAAGRPRQGVEG